MTEQQPFKWRHFQSDIILLCIRWSLRYPLSYRQLEEMMVEQGLHVDHTTIYRWVQCYAPELEKRCRPYLMETSFGIFCNTTSRYDMLQNWTHVRATNVVTSQSRQRLSYTFLGIGFSNSRSILWHPLHKHRHHLFRRVPLHFYGIHADD